MTRTPPANVTRVLREEVGYACPARRDGVRCSAPFLEYHHFDPPWAKQPHHNPQGMIALCNSCHPKADAGTWTKAELHAFKSAPSPLEQVRAHFPWAESQALWSVGSNVVVPPLGPFIGLRVGDLDVVRSATANNGRLLLSLELLNRDGTEALAIEENELRVWPPKPGDLNVSTGGTHCSCWVGTSKATQVGLDLKFRRYSEVGFLAWLRKIWKGDVINADAWKMRCEARKMIGRGPASDRSEEALMDLPAHCRDSDGCIPVVHVHRMVAFDRSGARFTVNASGSSSVEPGPRCPQAGDISAAIATAGSMEGNLAGGFERGFWFRP